jgi:hypothetical protein
VPRVVRAFKTCLRHIDASDFYTWAAAVSLNEALVGRRRDRHTTWMIVVKVSVPRRTAVGLCSALVAVSGACFPASRPSEEPAGRAATAQGQIRALFERRADALAAGSVEEYLGSLSPAARSFEAPIARGAAKLPLAGVRMVVREADVAPDGQSVDGARIDFTYWFEGLAEDNLFHIFLINDLERRGSRWQVTSSAIDEARYDMHAGSPLPLWATGPFRTTRSEHFLALYRPGPGGIGSVVQLAERAYADLFPKLTFDPEPGYLLVAARNEDEYAELVGPRTAESSIAIATAESVRAAGRGMSGLGGERPETRHMVVDLEAATGGGSVSDHAHVEGVGVAQVIQHELGHLALLRVTSTFTPGWVKEGAAMYLAGERRIDEWSAGLATGAFEDLSFRTLSRAENVRGEFGYSYVNAATSYLIERFGAKTFFEFYRGFKDFEVIEVKPDKATRSERTQRLLNLVYGITERDLDRATRAYIKDAAG